MDEGTQLLDGESLYKRFGAPLEKDHHGEYVAIAEDGSVIVDSDDVAVIDEAIKRFGSGKFIFRRIGYSYVDKLR